ncbi:MAG: hypothetical protein ACRDFX_05415 [Chloroflexota bacterium]
MSLAAVFMGAILYLLGRGIWRLPLRIVAPVALVSSLKVSGLLPLPFPRSTWVLPQRWAGLGHSVYAALFGGFLGLGVVTIVPSEGIYTLLAYGLAAPRLLAGCAVFFAFGAARTLPLLLLAGVPRLRKDPLHESLERVSTAAKLLLPAETVLLAAAGILFLTP